MTDPVFPALPGLAWSVTKTPSFMTRKQSAISGRELRLLDQIVPTWEWTLVYDFLRDQNDTRAGAGLGSGYDELRTLAGFFLARHGSFQAFVFDDPADDTTAGETIGTGDGTTTAFQLVRTFGGFAEPITAPNIVSAVRDNGTTVPGTGYAVNSATGIVTFTAPPAAGHVLTADFTYRFRVRFSDDNATFENFMYQLWSLKQIKFRSALL